MDHTWMKVMQKCKLPAGWHLSSFLLTIHKALNNNVFFLMKRRPDISDVYEKHHFQDNVCIEAQVSTCAENCAAVSESTIDN